MTEIHGKSISVQVSTRFELARVRVIGSRLYFLAPATQTTHCRSAEALACVAGVLKGKGKGVLGKEVLGARETQATEARDRKIVKRNF